MKKQIVLNLIAAVLFVMAFLNMDDLSLFFEPYSFLLMFVPILAGLMSALVQNKDKSYDYITEILIGSILFGVLSVLIGRFFNYSSEFMGNASLLEYINPFSTDNSISAFVLMGVYMIGALVGVAVRGASLVFLPKYQKSLNFDISFWKSFSLAMIILLGANGHYVLMTVPPDGRWKFQLPMTSIFILVYLGLYYLLSKKMIKNTKYNYIIWVYSAFLSFVFFCQARNIEFNIQYNEWLYLKYIAVAPYLVIFGLGIVCYSVLLVYLGKEEVK